MEHYHVRLVRESDRAESQDFRRWLENNGGEAKLERLRAFFVRERCLLTLRTFVRTGGKSGVPVPRFETRRTANGTPYRLFIGFA